MRKLPSTGDVAQEAGVSRATVSYVLNARADQSIPEETRARVLAAAQKLGYRPNRLARGMIKGRTRTFGVIVSRLDSRYFAQIVLGFQEECDRHDHRILLEHTQHDPAREARQVNLLLEYRVDGLLWVADEWTAKAARHWIEGLAVEGLACVLTDDRTYAAFADCVVTADFEGAQAAVRYLIAQGHRRIAHLGASDRLSNSRDRHAGYMAALREAGLESDPALLVRDHYDVQDPVGAFRTFLRAPNPPTAIFTANDDMAVAMMRQAKAHGLRVPQDLSVIGYGDLEVTEYMGLTTVRQNPYEVGRQAARCLLERMENPERERQTIVVPTELILRETCGPPRPPDSVLPAAS
jgi:LacI family transcriptional regulator